MLRKIYSALIGMDQKSNKSKAEQAVYHRTVKYITVTNIRVAH